jgi:pimeloyl-ACP methyl ester carboxylesterase
MTTLVLIPGACHGAWCWERLEPLLGSRGYDVVAVDLACDDVTAGFDRYVEVTLAAVPPSADDIVLVGHSLGAHTAVRAAAIRPVLGIVFVCGVIPPRPGERNDAEPPMEAPGTFDGLEIDDEGRFWFPEPSDAIRAFYDDCDEATAAWAVPRLRRQSRTPHARIGEPVGPPACASVSIVCTEDRVASAAWGRWAAAERLLGAPVIELGGAHSPFLSRPAELAEALDGAVRRF